MENGLVNELPGSAFKRNVQCGPCGHIEVHDGNLTKIQEPIRLIWSRNPKTVLVIKKMGDRRILSSILEMLNWLIQEKQLTVWIEDHTLDELILMNEPSFGIIKDTIVTFQNADIERLADKIDLIISMGGDGTLLRASLLFQDAVPPLMAFHFGSFGFLTPFHIENFQQHINTTLAGNAPLMLRNRLKCTFTRNHQTIESMNILNEVVINRGSSYLVNLDLYLNGNRITSVQGDGLIVSTPTGSTAYALATGASMMHPSISVMMITPICPHSLSFRPIIVPADVKLKITITPNSRHTSWISYDGRYRQELTIGDHLEITTSQHPIPSICSRSDYMSDWFESLSQCLHWNLRKHQRPVEK